MSFFPREMASPSSDPKPLSQILRESGARALAGGIPGAAAMAVQVTSLMWLRTTMNYQYRYGSTTREALRHLYQEGGIRRFYRGYAPALVQGPLSRFGDTAANAGALAFLNSYEQSAKLPIEVKTAFASVSSGLFRIFLMPVDTVKTILQVEGKEALSVLRKKFSQRGLSVFYQGAIATSVATVVGHYPWFYTNNKLHEILPRPAPDSPKFYTLARNGFIGFVASAISDTTSNSIRVIKTTKQTHRESISYATAVKEVVQKDGVIGLFGRGLKTRLLTNGLQGLMFSILWKEFERIYHERS